MEREKPVFQTNWLGHIEVRESSFKTLFLTTLFICLTLFFPQMVQAIPSVSFSATSNTTVLASPRDVAIGDFNLDGKPDLVVTYNSTTATKLSVLLGNGDGTFQPKADYTTATNPLGAAIGDFNRDGFPDLVVTNYSANSISIFFNKADGTGTFNAKIDYPVASSPYGVAVTDLNGDTIQDLVVTRYGTSYVAVLIGKNDGTFNAAVSLSTATNPISVSVGDFNSDGKQDLAVTCYGSSSSCVSVLKGKGDGTFYAKVNYPTIAAGVVANPYDLTLGDFNKDGITDLAVPNYTTNNLSILFGNGDCTFQNATTYSTNLRPEGVVSADYNGDGNLDLAVTNYSSVSVSVLLGDGSGAFPSKMDCATGSGPRGIGTADFNLDGKQDLICSNFSSTNVSLLLNTTPAVSDQLTLSGFIPSLTVGKGDFDLSGLTLQGTDQWGTPINISDRPVTWSVYGSAAGIINDHFLTPLQNGSGTISACIGENTSNSLPFVVQDLSNAGLSGLSVSGGTLNPAFTGETVAYQAEGLGNVNSILVTADCIDPASSLTINGMPTPSGTPCTVGLNQGANLIPIVVTAPDHESQRAYIISVNGTVSDANLAVLTIDSGPLAFSADTVSYTVDVADTVSSITLTATPSDAKAIMIMNGTIIQSGSPSTINLNMGINIINLMVVAQDASTKTYTISVTRAMAAGVVCYEITPISEPAFEVVPTAGNMMEVVVRPGSTGMKYLNVNISPKAGHAGEEVVVFSHFRGYAQLGLIAMQADFDAANTAKAGFNVQPGDRIRVYLVDYLDNDSHSNPVPL